MKTNNKGKKYENCFEQVFLLPNITRNIKRGFNNKLLFTVFTVLFTVNSNFVFELVKSSVYNSSCKTKYFLIFLWEYLNWVILDLNLLEKTIKMFWYQHTRFKPETKIVLFEYDRVEFVKKPYLKYTIKFEISTFEFLKLQSSVLNKKY